MAVSTTNAPQAIALEWIAEDGSGPNCDREVRTRIRKQAMKLAGMARKQRGNGGKRSCGQQASPDLLTSPSSSISSSSSSSSFYSSPPTTATTDGEVTSRSSTPSPKAELCRALVPASSMTQLMKMHGVNVLDFWSLMNQIHVGSVARDTLREQAESLTCLVRNKQGAFSFELPQTRPAILANDGFLDDALECLSIRAFDLMNPSRKVASGRSIEAYGTALKSLQKAIYDPAVCSSAEVLCAVEALSLYEILDRSSGSLRQNAWSDHVSGASRLIQVRGSTNFQTDFEKTLLFSAASSIVCECLRKNQACFLEGEEWQRLLRDIVMPDELFSFRSDLSMTIFGLYIRMPGLFRQVSHIVCHQETVSAKKIENVTRAVQQFRKELTSWKSDFQSALIQAVLFEEDGSLASMHDSRSMLQGSFLALSIIGSRLLGALDSVTAARLEDDVHVYAQELEGLSADLSVSNPLIGFYLGQKKIATAKSTMDTTVSWQSANRNSRGIIENWAFRKWCEAIGRQTCCDTGVWYEVVEQ